MRIAVLVKQIPAFEEMALGPDGRLTGDAVDLEMSAYCRRAVSQAVAIAREFPGSTTTVFSLGPPTALDVVREAVGWGIDHGVLISDPRFAGSDTVATARTIVAALDHTGPFDLVLVGRNSLDADTGQVGPGVAELLGWGFLSSVKVLELGNGSVSATCEEDDGESRRLAPLPLVIATAERLIEPAKVSPDRWPASDDPRLSILDAEDLGAGPWGSAASPTVVGEIRVRETARARVILDGPVDEVVARTVEMLDQRGALVHAETDRPDESVVEVTCAKPTRTIAVVVEPHRLEVARELLGEANTLAKSGGASVVAIVCGPHDLARLSSWGADHVEILVGKYPEERGVARAISALVTTHHYWSMLFPSTAWGREVAGRVSARLGAGLTGDALEFDVESTHGDVVLVAWKSALGGQLLVAIRSSSAVQLTTVRPGALPLRTPRVAHPITASESPLWAIAGVTVLDARRNDDVEELERATHVIGVGGGVPPQEYAVIEAFAATLGATLAASRKVTDKGWLPRARQLGITGRSIRPNLYVAIGVSGKFNHTVGVRSAATILAINTDRTAPIFGSCDIGIVGDWRDVVPRLAEAIRLRR